MSLETLKRFLEKHNIDFKVANYGSNYFSNAPALNYEALQIELIFKTIPELNQMQRAIEKYINRYNFDIFHRGRLQCDIYGNYHYFLAVRTQEAATAAENYYLYEDKARKECELIYHFYYCNGLVKTHTKLINDNLFRVMAKYGNMYNRSLIKVLTA